MPRLTVKAIAAAAPRRARYFLWDTDPVGLGVRIQTSGVKSYVVRYRTAGGTQRMLVLDRVGVATLDQARDHARDALTAARRGQDPAQARQDARCAPAVQDLADRFMAEHARARRKPKTVRAYESFWRHCVLPRWQTRRVADIAEADVMALHGALSATPVQANRVVRMLSKAFNLAEAWGWRPKRSNPVFQFGAYRYPERRAGKAMQPHQLAALGAAMRAEPANSAVPLVRLMLLTGCRPDEVRHFRVGYLDRSRSLLILPDTKTGPRTVPLSPQGLDYILELVGSRTDSDALLLASPGRRGWYRLRDAAGLRGFRLYDLRHTFGTVAGMLNTPQRTIADLLGHAQLSTTEIYVHSVRQVQARAAAATGRAIDDMLAGRQKVVEMKAPRRTGGR